MHTALGLQNFKFHTFEKVKQSNTFFLGYDCAVRRILLSDATGGRAIRFHCPVVGMSVGLPKFTHTKHCQSGCVLTPAPPRRGGVCTWVCAKLTMQCTGTGHYACCSSFFTCLLHVLGLQSVDTQLLYLYLLQRKSSHIWCCAVPSTWNLLTGCVMHLVILPGTV